MAKKSFQKFKLTLVHIVKELVMKTVKNDSLQTFTVFFNTEKGCLERLMKPGESIVVPESYITEQVKILTQRKIFKISNA